jgi:hypothetical protein
MEHIAVGLVEGDRVVGPLNIYPEKSQTLDPLQSMPAEGIVDCIRRQVENVAGGEKIEAIGIGFPGIIRDGVIEDSPNFHQAKGFALQAALSSALTGKAAGAKVRLFNDADVMAAGIAAAQGKLHELTRVWTLGNGAVFSELTPYSDAGMMTVYAGTAADTVGQVIDLTIQEFRALKESPVTEEELRRSKNHLKGSLMLSLESTSSRMSNLARQELYFGRFYSLDEILAGIEAVTREELQSLARQYFQSDQIAVTVLGPLNGFTVERSRLAC